MQIQDEICRIPVVSGLSPDWQAPEVFWLLSAGVWNARFSEQYYTTGRAEKPLKSVFSGLVKKFHFF